MTAEITLMNSELRNLGSEVRNMGSEVRNMGSEVRNMGSDVRDLVTEVRNQNANIEQVLSRDPHEIIEAQFQAINLRRAQMSNPPLSQAGSQVQQILQQLPNEAPLQLSDAQPRPIDNDNFGGDLQLEQQVISEPQPSMKLAANSGQSNLSHLEIGFGNETHFRPSAFQEVEEVKEDYSTILDDYQPYLHPGNNPLKRPVIQSAPQPQPGAKPSPLYHLLAVPNQAKSCHSQSASNTEQGRSALYERQVRFAKTRQIPGAEGELIQTVVEPMTESEEEKQEERNHQQSNPPSIVGVPSGNEPQLKSSSKNLDNQR